MKFLPVVPLPLNINRVRGNELAIRIIPTK